MNLRLSRLTVVAVLLASGATISRAQTATTGAFQGTVTDTAGAPLAGAIIRMTSIQITRTATTGPDGKFQAGLMNSGTWQITVTKAGYTSGTQNVILGINESKALNFKLPKEGSAVVEVVGTASIVDSNSTTTGLNISMDELGSIPTGRTANEMVFLSPGVTSGGNTFGSSAPGLGISINGASGAENSFIVDGLVTNDFRYGGTATNLPSDFIESIDVQTGGYKPEFSALGGVFSVVTKSGSNDFRGSAWISYEPLSMQAVNKKNEFFNQAVLFAGPPVRDPINNGDSAARERTEIGATAGGAFIKDKFFYFVGLNSIGSKSDSFQNFTDVTVGARKENDTAITTKFNYFINTDQQLTFSFFGNKVVDDAPDDRPGQFGDANQGFKHTITSNNYSLIYDWTIQSNLVLSVKGGVAKIHDVLDLAAPDVARVEDSHWFNGGVTTGTYTQQKNPYLRGGFGRYNPDEGGTTQQLKADLSWILGTHSLKFGISTLESEYHRTAATSGGAWYIIRAAGDRIDKRWQTDDSTVKATFNAFYVQDTWDITPNFKLFYGLRYETQAQKDPNGVTFMKFDSLSDYTQPRIGFTWDPEKDGKTKVSGSFARYFEQIPQRLAARVYGNEVYLRNRWTNPAPPAPPIFIYSSTGIGTIIGPPTGVTDFATPYARDPLAEGTKLPRRTEFTAGYERTIQEGLTVGIHGKHRTMDSILEDSVIRGKGGDNTVAYDPDERAILWNPGRSVSWTTQTGEHYSTTNSFFDPAKNVYDSVDFTLVKQTKRSYFSFSYTWSRSEGNYEGLVNSSSGQADSSITASFDEWPYVGTGPLPLDRTNVIKAFMSRNWDLGPGLFTFGLNWVYQTGTPISNFNDGSTSNPPLPDVGGYGNSTPVDMTLGQFGRTPATNNVDVKFDYSWNATPKVKLSPTVDIYNLFNTRYTTRVLQQSTDSGGNPDLRYGYATDWQRGRRVRFGFKVQF